MRSNHLFLLLFGSAALSLAACSQEKKTETTTTTDGTDTTVTTTTTTVDTVRFHSDAEAAATRVVQDLSLTDTAVVRKVQTTYHRRAHELAAIETRPDTTGRYAALRAANDEADRELRSTLNDPARYKVYEQNRPAYYVGTPYTVVVAEKAPSGPAVTKIERKDNGEVKIKYADGSKVKVDEDGDRKVKHANGSKVKHGDDGHKVKP